MKIKQIAIIIGLAITPALYAQTTASQTQSNDPRQFVEMPPEAQQLMRKDMLNFLNTLTQIIGFLATNQLNEAAKIAENKMGNSARGKHRRNPMGPGKFMPEAMHKIGWNMHKIASEFAQVAKKGDTQKALAALQKVTGTCMACHYSYRTR
jgi:cytochrome c556